jgi:uncharacterized protein YihD (DUF1040 family)
MSDPYEDDYDEDAERAEAARIEQIESVIGLLGAVWLEHPDWRLAQLVCNAAAHDSLAAQAARQLSDDVEDKVIAAGLMAMVTRRHVMTPEDMERARRVAFGEDADVGT